MNITVTIQAPELARSLHALANAMSGKTITAEAIAAQWAEPVAPIQQPVQTPMQQPIQQPVQTPMPTQQPIQTQQPAPQPPVMPVTTAPVETVPTMQQSNQQQPQAVPTATPSYNMDQLAVAATQLVDAGRRNDLVSLLASFGVNALTELPKEQYGAFATQLRAMGAKI